MYTGERLRLIAIFLIACNAVLIELQPDPLFGYFCYTLKAYTNTVHYEFIESSLFSRMVHDYFSENDYTAFQQFLLDKEVLDHDD